MEQILYHERMFHVEHSRKVKSLKVVRSEIVCAIYKLFHVEQSLNIKILKKV